MRACRDRYDLRRGSVAPSAAEDVVSSFLVAPPRTDDPARAEQLARVRDVLVAHLRQPATLAAIRTRQRRPVRTPARPVPPAPEAALWAWVLLAVLIGVVTLWLLTR